MVAQDTSPSAARLQEEIHRRFTPAERLRMAFEMSEFARSLSRAGLRSRRPDLTEAELDAEMLYQLYGFRRPPTT
jgi:Rv0078B-related antitoxin